MTPSKVIVTGATGQDGSYMCEYLLKETEVEVLAAVRRTSQPILGNLMGCLNHPRFRLVFVDLNDSISITELIKTENPDYFINFAACTFVADSWRQPALTMQANTQSLIHILEAVRQFAPKCRVYSAGSSEQFGNVAYSPQDEKHPMRPRSIYGVSKCAAGLVCKVYRETYNLYVVHGLLFNHESERRQKYFVTRKITLGAAAIRNAIAHGAPFEPIELGNINALRDWSHASDFVDGIWRMMNQEKYKGGLMLPWDNRYDITEYVLSSNETHSVREFVELTFKTLGLDGEWQGSGLDEKFVVKDKGVVLVKINPEFYRPNEVETLYGDSSLARKELGWEPKINFETLVMMMALSDYAKVKSS